MPSAAFIRGCPTRPKQNPPSFVSPPVFASEVRRSRFPRIPTAFTAATMIVEQDTELPIDKNKAVSVTVVSPSSNGPQAMDTVGVILAHGAGGNKDSGHLPSIAHCLGEAGFPSIRFTCKPPNMKTRIKYFKAVLSEAPRLPHLQNVSAWIFCGHSMGGRVACAVADEGCGSVLGCILSSYPLHPPGKHEDLRDHPLCDIKLPLLFLRGTRDPFCTAEPWEDVTQRMSSSKLKIHTLETGDHSLKVKGGKVKNKEVMDDLCREVVSFATEISATCSPECGDPQQTTSGSMSEEMEMDGAEMETGPPKRMVKRKAVGVGENGDKNEIRKTRKRRIRRNQ
ncbi:hypothetical protein BSKO_07241 [Bryopsis sp. KO-2023]|nr:hypothetical protein BSKO_07241 [Bryopsis sp. KO-2023]